MDWTLLGIIFGCSVLGLVVAAALAQNVLKRDQGPEEMRKISDAIREGAEAFLRQQNKAIALLAVVLGIVIFLLYAVAKGDMHLAWQTMLAFFLGAACSALAGYVGMWVSIRSNIRTAAAARTSLHDALQTSLRGGAVSGLIVVGMSLLGVAGLFTIYYFADMRGDAGKLLSQAATQQDHAIAWAHLVQSVPGEIVGYGFGASFVALFAQLGGGIYTKAADVGADLVGKVEAGIPEDDPRNPAVIADLVGDNVGDCAGRGADLFESTAAENIGAMILGVGLWPYFGLKGLLFPLVARSFGVIASIVGIYSVGLKDESKDPMSALNKGYYITSVLAAGGFFAASYWLLRIDPNNIPQVMLDALGGDKATAAAYATNAQDAWLYFFGCGLIGIVTAIAFVYITQYYTEYKYRPVKSIAEASQTGPATNIIAGMGVAFECTALPVLVIAGAILGSYTLGAHAFGDKVLGGFNPGFYGTAVATMGMLGTAAYILAMDTFGPITDNAGGIVEMSQQTEEIRKKTDRLDAVGNTTKALTKGYAIGSAALAAFLLFNAYLDQVQVLVGQHIQEALKATGPGSGNSLYLKIEDIAAQAGRVDLSQPAVFVGALLGAMLVFLFSALAIRAVGTAAYYVINDVRAQFKEKPGILEGKDKPDYARCVGIVTKGALRQMIVPGLLVVLTPIVVGLLFRALGSDNPILGAQVVAALLMVGTIGGILLATVLNNGGGAWDNAKKYIEMGQYGGKRSDAHKAAVVGDTVGDPFKDTAGPSLHVLIKLLSTLTLVLAPIFLRAA
jgi:K(+)-stimulated pyrophosphate-energized sodium pump